LQFPARIPASPEQVGESRNSWLQQLLIVYQLAGSRAKPGRHPWWQLQGPCCDCPALPAPATAVLHW
jgi:hypothetical protein